MSRVADTSAVLAAVDLNDPRQEAALDGLTRLEPLLIPLEVVGEAVGVTHRRYGFERARLLWSDLRSLPHVRFITEPDPERVGAEFEAAQGRLSWVDAAVVYWCKKTSSAPLCFDPDIEAAVREPRPERIRDKK